MNVSQIKNISIADFDYPLPDERIALHPIADRQSCKLLLSGANGEVSDRLFSDLPELLGDSGMVIFNNTKVIHARLFFRKPTGALIEVFLLDPLDPADYNLVFQSRSSCKWACMVGNLKKWKEPSVTREISLPSGQKTLLTATKGQRLAGTSIEISFSWDNSEVNFADILEGIGRIPIPPYLNRESEEADNDDYQTVYSKISGSVAAPTAGLHFTSDLLARLETVGQQLREVTLHVGAGTFQPVKCLQIADHPMHTEVFSVEVSFLRELAAAIRRSAEEPKYMITAVGTTSVRTLESLPCLGRQVELNPELASLHLGQWEAYEHPMSRQQAADAVDSLADYAEARGLKSLTASTAIMIAPGFCWKVVDRMVTNFHQPSSTLLLLVSSFLEPDALPTDKPRWRSLYDHALSNDYRFLSYGDACLFYPMKNCFSVK